MRLKSITYAGHSAVFIQTDNGSIGIDPWINGNPNVPSDFKVPEDLNLIVLTHGHADHVGDTARLCKEYGAKVAATYELAMIMSQEGVPEKQIIAMNRGGAVDINGLHIGLTTALHSSSYETKNGILYAGEACGVIVKNREDCIYHAGDTAIFSDMQLIGAFYQPTYALLPIGDRFTMGPEEAAEAAVLVRCKTAIPIHYKTFGILTGTLEAFKKACAKRGVALLELQPGKTLTL